MKLTPQKAMELRRKGIKVDMRQVVRESKQNAPEPAPEPVKVEPVKVEPPKPDTTPLLIDGLIQVAKANEGNTSNIVSILNELAKPKPKRSWRCTIGRNSRGEMATVDINEA